MTGYGEASNPQRWPGLRVEIRTVNNRHLKVTVRGTEPYPYMESEVEKIVRRHVRRGTVQIRIQIDRQATSLGSILNTAILQAYLRGLSDLCDSVGKPELLPQLLPGVISLPGVSSSSALSSPPEGEWDQVEEALDEALTSLNDSRAVEGRHMAEELTRYGQEIHSRLASVREVLPNVMRDYRHRLLERVRQGVADAGVTLEESHLIREVALFADRTDVSEEVSRLVAHLKQYEEILQTKSEAAGRRLEFVVQEIGREINTLGSKAGDVSISRHVVEMKATLEKVRELIQNVE